MKRPSRFERGFTLIEAMVVVAVAAIVLAVALPNFRQYTVRSRMNGALQDVEQFVSVARLQAINAQRPAVVVFIRPNGTYSDLTTGQPASFLGKNAVIAFVDLDNSGAFDSGDRFLDGYVLDRTLAYRKPDGGEALPVARIAYDATGALQGGTAAQVYIGDEVGNFMRLVFVGSGLVHREKNVPGTPDQWLGEGKQRLWTWVY